jgi:gas vesicle protein GvpL/GvpF
VPTYLYGLVLAGNAARVPKDFVGLQGSAVRVLTCGSLGALVSTVERMPARATLEDVRVHDGVLQAVVDGKTTAAAVRFGQSFAGDDEACRHVTDHAERLAGVLEEYDGCVEVRLLLAHAPEPEPEPEPAKPLPTQSERGPGRAYLEQLRHAREHMKRLALRSALGPVVRAERVEELPRSRGVVFSHLVRRDELPVYRDAVATIPALAEAKMVGPLALYSFAEPSP